MSDETPLFDQAEMEECLNGLYRPDAYAEGEALCIEILEDVDPEWEPATLYLMLFLAAQDAEEDALQLVDELSDESLFEALTHLTFGAGTVAEEVLYEEIKACALERGLEEELEEYFSTVVKAIPRQDISSALSSWE